MEDVKRGTVEGWPGRTRGGGEDRIRAQVFIRRAGKIERREYGGPFGVQYVSILDAHRDDDGGAASVWLLVGSAAVVRFGRPMAQHIRGYRFAAAEMGGDRDPHRQRKIQGHERYMEYRTHMVMYTKSGTVCNPLFRREKDRDPNEDVVIGRGIFEWPRNVPRRPV
jgi:hypothetical protein